MSKRAYYRFSGRRQQVTGATIKAWAKLARAALAYRAGDAASREALSHAYEPVRHAPLIGQDSATNPCQCLREAANVMLHRAVFFQRPDDLTYYAQRVAEACAAASSLNDTMKEAG